MAINNEVQSAISVDITPKVPGGKRALVRQFGADEVNKFIRKSLQASCELIRDYAREHHRYEDMPARQIREGYIGLTRAIHFMTRPIARADKRNNSYIGTVKINEKEAPYGKYQVMGTKSPIPHNKKSTLTFFSDRYGRWYTHMKEVSGIPKDDFIHKAYKANRQNVARIFDEYLRRFLDGRKL